MCMGSRMSKEEGRTGVAQLVAGSYLTTIAAFDGCIAKKFQSFCVGWFKVGVWCRRRVIAAWVACVFVELFSGNEPSTFGIVR